MKKTALILMLAAMAATFTGCGANQSNVSINGDHQSQSQSEDHTGEPEPSKTQENRGKIGDFTVSIDKAEIKDSSKGKKSMLVTYTFTNGSKKTVMFDQVLSAEAYQNDTACPQASMKDQTYDIENILTEVKPGETSTVYEAYVLQDDSDLTVRVSKAGQTEQQEQNDTTMITRTFKVK